MSFVCVSDYEVAANQKLPKYAADYYKGGAGEEYSLKLNKTIFNQFRICPRVLRNVETRDLSCNILGLNLSMPIGVAPAAMQRMAHPDGEIATAEGAGKAKTVFTLSLIATTSIEELSQKVPDTLKWMQLYIYKDRNLTQKFVERAEKAGFKALVVTVDVPVFGLRRDYMRDSFKVPSDITLANFTTEESLNGKLGAGLAIFDYPISQIDPTLTWQDIKWLKRISKLPILLKGILTVPDAIMAADLGIDGIIVSNHGGRQLDSAILSIEILPEIVKAVGNRVTIIVDGGIRQGTDVFKALALGAKMVLVGRPAIWGLTVNGRDGVENLLNILKNELDNAMALAGCCKLSEITNDMIVHENQCHKL